MGHGKKPEGERKKSVKDGSFRKQFSLFLTVFFIIWLFSYLLVGRFPGFIVDLQNVVSREVAFFLSLFGYNFTRSANTFMFHTGHGAEKMYIIAECTGLYTTIIYFAIIGAYPARVKEKLMGLLIGIPSIHILNLFRMVFISIVLFHSKRLFHFFHSYFWQVGFVIFMLLLVIFWMGKIVKGPKREMQNRESHV